MKNFLMFVGGVVVGAVISSMYHKNKYEEQINDEFKEAREYRKQEQKKREAVDNESVEDEETHDDIDNSAEEVYEERLEKAKDIINYNKYSKKDEVESLRENTKKPFVVTPDDFASIPGFDTDTFYFYENNIIADENQEIIDDVERIFGLTVNDIRDQFGVYEEDSVYIRNERMKTDYEILRELDTYKKRNGE